MRLPALLLLAVFATSSLCAEGKRLAFVVGVDRYDHLAAEAQLKVAVADARRMKTTLESLDPPFTVRLVADGDVRGVEAAFDAFLDEAKGAECALVYFAGHGVEYHGANFLLVKDTAISDISPDVERMKRRLGTQAVSLQGWVDSLDATRAQVKVVILDCCRDNPLKADDGSGTRSVVSGSRGLAQVTPPSGTLISYSADAGQRANDGLFTEVLARNLREPGLNILKVFAKTREEVREISTAWAAEDETRGLAPDFRRSRHEPAEYNKLNLAGTDFAFTRGVPAAVMVEDSATSAEMAKLRAELEAERKARAEAERKAAMAVPTVPAPSTPDPRPSTPTMAKTDPAPAPAFPAARGMEGSRAGEVRTFGGIEMVWCPPGEFLMGSPVGEADRSDDETQHRVTLTRGFWLAKTECTQAQWESVMGGNLSYFRGADLPVENVSWDYVQGWLAKMNEKHPLPAGWKWDLPTEAQWEYACRAGTETVFSFGNDLDSTQANFDGNDPYGAGKDGPYLEKTVDVASYAANDWSLYDMHGNVWEWCRDWYDENYYDDGQTDPTGPATGSRRVARGGNWRDNGGYCRAAYRSRDTPDYRDLTLGFRPAAVPTAR